MYQEKYRPRFHYTPPLQWMNDPNGMVYYEGEYHLFYQYHPYSTVWGPMHWGHAISKDLVHWETLPVALYPDWLGVIYSGSAVIDYNNTSGLGSRKNPPMVAIYSYHNHIKETLGKGDEIESQGVAFSLDRGRTWTKYEHNPVLKNPGIRHFRDPKVCWYEPDQKWIMVLAAQDHVAFYSSGNLLDWHHESDFGYNVGSLAGIWECPDLFAMDIENESGSKWVLLVSQVPGGPNGGSATQYFVGDFDGKTFTLDASLKQRLTRVEAVFPRGTTFEDFEGDLSRWNVSGATVQLAPMDELYATARDTGERMLAVDGSADSGCGRAWSDHFEITRPYINFYLGGGSHSGFASFQLVVGNQVVRAQTADSSKLLNIYSWNVRDLQGKTAYFQVVDEAAGCFGRLYLDNIVLADEPASPMRETALWLDYGTDNYAGVTWSNIPASDGRTLFIGWSNNWLYGADVPTGPWRSAMTLPRELRLISTRDGYRLKSLPVVELQKLRKHSRTLANLALEQRIDLARQLHLDGQLMELELDLQTGEAHRIDLTLANELGEKVLFTIDRDEGRFLLDRTASGVVDFNAAFPSRQRAPLTGDSSRLSLHLFIDQSLLEIFINGGETVMTAQVFPEKPYDQVEISASSPVLIKSVTGSELDSIWKNTEIDW